MFRHPLCLFVLGLMLTLVIACNARDERPNSERQQNAPMATPIGTPTSVPATATLTRVPPSPTAIPPSPTLIPPTATGPAPTVTVTPTPNRLAFKKGRNDYTINVDDTPRKFIVHVPNAYDPARSTPVVFMFHGTNQTGNVMYERTTWVDKAEKENILVVFPTSWQYPLIGERGLHEKWNHTGLVALVPPGTLLKDDVHFVRVMLDNLKNTFNVDSKRIFATGFSNGGQFTTRLVMEMNDVFAAFTISGLGFLTEPGIEVSQVTTRVNASVYSVLGTNDDKVSEGTGHPLPLPLRPQDINNDPLLQKALLLATTILSLEPTPIVDAQPLYTTMTFNKSTVGAKNEYVFRMIGLMGHVYPDKDNNRARLDAPDMFWEFFLRHPKP